MLAPRQAFVQFQLQLLQTTVALPCRSMSAQQGILLRVDECAVRNETFEAAADDVATVLRFDDVDSDAVRSRHAYERVKVCLQNVELAHQTAPETFVVAVKQPRIQINIVHPLHAAYPMRLFVGLSDSDVNANDDVQQILALRLTTEAVEAVMDCLDGNLSDVSALRCFFLHLTVLFCEDTEWFAGIHAARDHCAVAFSSRHCWRRQCGCDTVVVCVVGRVESAANQCDGRRIGACCSCARDSAV